MRTLLKTEEAFRLSSIGNLLAGEKVFIEAPANAGKSICTLQMVIDIAESQPQNSL